MKKLLAVFMLLFALNVQSAEYMDDSTSIVRGVKQNIGWATTADAVYDSIIYDDAKEAMLLVSAATGGYIILDTVTTTAYDHMVSFDSLIEIVQHATFFNRDSLSQLEWADVSGWDTLEAVDDFLDTENEWADRLPSYFDWNGNYLLLFPVPGHTGDSIVIAGYAKPTDVEGLSIGDVSEIHRPAVIYYATAMFATRLGLPESEAWMNKFTYWINTINATINRKEYKVER